MPLLRLLIALVLLALPLSTAAEVRLLMADQPGCIYCERWTEEIGPAYPKTDVGRAAPLQRFDLRDTPEGVTLDRRVIFTPTFILVRDGVEVSRVEGYGGDEFFWFHIETMLSEAGIEF